MTTGIRNSVPTPLTTNTSLQGGDQIDDVSPNSHTESVTDTKKIESLQSHNVTTDEFIQRLGSQKGQPSPAPTMMQNSRPTSSAPKGNLLDRMGEGLKSFVASMEQKAAEFFGYRKVDISQERLDRCNPEASDPLVQLLVKDRLSFESAHEVLRKFLPLDGKIDKALRDKIRGSEAIKEHLNFSLALADDVRDEMAQQYTSTVTPYIDSYRLDVLKITWTFLPEYLRFKDLIDPKS